MKSATQKAPTKRELTLSKFDDLIKTNNGTKEDFLNYIIFLYTNNNKPVLAIFGPRGYKPETHYNFRTEEQRADYLADQKKSIQRRHDESQRMLQQCNEEKKDFEVNKILVSSWGYEQTNIDFYIILERKNDFITIQKIGENRIPSDKWCDRGTTTPNKDILIGEPFRKKIDKWASVSINSYQRARVWDGKPEGWSSYA
jgi:hypothetical protein